MNDEAQNMNDEAQKRAYDNVIFAVQKPMQWN